MDERKIFMGLGAFAVLLFLVAMLMTRDDGPDVGELIAKEIAPVSDAVAALGDRVEGIEGELKDMSGQLVDAVLPEDVSAVHARVDEVSAQASALSDSLEDMKGSLAETVAAAVAAVPAPAAPAAPAPAETDNASGGEPGFTPGQTAVFADGALRVFISRLDSAANEVRVSIAGDMKTLSEGQGRTLPAGNNYCRITVDGVSDNGAVMSAICGDDLPPPEGISAGETAVFQDGAVRVFGSLIGEDEARLSINRAMHTLAIGRSAPTMAGDEKCRVMLDALDRGHASVSAICGADVTVSEVTGPGSTVVLGDGAARVFVAAVTEDSARFAVNGQTLSTGGTGHSVDLDDGCAVVVEDIAEGKASFSYACE